ncbi:MAG: ABC transporter ATP-binding protein [Clostridium sp.]|uniref:ABC transporter ATP-binding protein n=1 Tax=Clostridium sp. TaxID=1506 RepID=UPI0025BBFA05|nr:ABC transporter ATP-binding protein [Clostridium sp.]MCE5219847.1 ABC transporter ATP-binding protein [Clostridium sp.]
MDNNLAIKCTNLYKKYTLYSGDFERLKGLFLPFYKPKEFVALSNINLEFKKGEIVGLIGLNGSGKSTLASIITGITYPTEGTVEVDGEVNMLSANAGMENHLTGVENIDYKCLLLGFDRSQTEMIKEDIIKFADIGIHINQPLRTYSSGMRSRLGFAISVHMNPDILIIDEALAVGDNSFTDKCLDKMNEFKEKGKTILFVSHSVTQMNDFCDKVVWLNKGNIVGTDIPEKIIIPYCGFAREFNAMSNDERNNLNVNLKEYQEKFL